MIPTPEQEFAVHTVFQTSEGGLERVTLMSRHRPLETISYWKTGGHLILDAPYQRGDVWGPLRRRNLIRSLLVGVPIPSIVVNDRFEAGWSDDCCVAVIDGKQRMTTILWFLEGRFAVPGSWFGQKADEVRFPDLPTYHQRGFRRLPLDFAEGRLPSLEAEREVFDLVNFGGVPQGASDEPTEDGSSS